MNPKAGFHNIPVDENSSRYLGIVTQDGLWKFIRMPFGLKGAPAHFQRTVMITLEGLPARGVVIYLDDIVIHADTVEEAWALTLEALRALASKGFMINIRKCKFLTDAAKIVGV